MDLGEDAPEQVVVTPAVKSVADTSINLCGLIEQ
jgi:hypothetical protein